MAKDPLGGPSERRIRALSGSVRLLCRSGGGSSSGGLGGRPRRPVQHDPFGLVHGPGSRLQTQLAS